MPVQFLQTPCIRRYLSRAACVMVAATIYPAAAETVPAGLLAPPPQVLVANEAADDDLFGTAVDLDASRVAIGATGVDQPTDRAGAVYLFEREQSAWREEAVLRLEGVGVDAGFGTDLALDGDWLAAGGPGVYAGEGAIYVFGHDDDAGWSQRHRFLLKDSQDFTFFGSALDMDRGLLVAGAPGYDGGAKDSGIVMTYTRADDGSWSEAGPLEPTEPRQGERFGSAVALDGERLLVGADGGGAAYIFEWRDGAWAQVGRVSEDLGERSSFGASVSLSGSLALVGAPFASNAEGEKPGAAVLYARRGGQWQRERVLRSDRSGRSDQFGDAVALLDTLALVAAPRDDADGDNAGAVFVFAPTDGEWTLGGHISGPEPAAYDEFGRSLAIDAEARTALVGTPDDAAPEGDASEHPGTVSVFAW